MKSIWPWLANEFGCGPKLLERPVVLPLQDPQPLLPCQSALEAVCPSHEVILRLVEHLL
jgi:hypothetical protein